MSEHQRPPTAEPLFAPETIDGTAACLRSKHAGVTITRYDLPDCAVSPIR